MQDPPHSAGPSLVSAQHPGRSRLTEPSRTDTPLKFGEPDYLNGLNDRDGMACRTSCGYTWTADDPGWLAQVLPPS